jgi:hypothetical protein
VVAGWAESQLFLHAIDGAGHPVARTVVADGLATYNISGLPIRLVPRPSSAPLLLWETSERNSQTLHIVPVASDGRSVMKQVDIDVGSEYFADVAAVGASVYLATGTWIDGQAGIRIRSLSADGVVLSTFDAQLGFVPDYLIGVVTGADDLRVVVGTHAVIVVQRLSSTGASLGSPIELAADVYDGPLWAILTGGETIALLSGATLDVARGGQVGALPAPPVSISVENSPGWYALVRRGPEAVAAWIGTAPNRLQVARITP